MQIRAPALLVPVKYPIITWLEYFQPIDMICHPFSVFIDPVDGSITVPAVTSPAPSPLPLQVSGSVLVGSFTQMTFGSRSTAMLMWGTAGSCGYGPLL